LLPQPPVAGSTATSALEGRTLEMNAVALSVLTSSIVLKEYLFRKTLKCGQEANSAVRAY
jgi:divalent metal cation (Fe/Co/Zn/Cd) transporter